MFALRHSLFLYFKRTPSFLTILVGLLLVSYQYLIGPLPIAAQLIFCSVLLLLVGIPHGALDHIIEQEYYIRRSKPFSMVGFIAKYLLIIAGYGLVWFWFPVLSLVLFLLISAWHFGETDLEHAPGTAHWSLARLVLGGFVLGFILLMHEAETTPILASIVQNDPVFMQVWRGCAQHSGPLLRGWLTLSIILTMLAYGQQPVPFRAGRLVRLGVVLLLTYPLPLLPAFMLYFGGWHSISSFGTIRSYLQQSVSAKKPLWIIWRQSMPLTLVAVFFLGGCAGLWLSYAQDFDPIPSLFILFSTITLPHIQVMHRLYDINN